MHVSLIHLAETGDSKWKGRSTEHRIESRSLDAYLSLSSSVRSEDRCVLDTHNPGVEISEVNSPSTLARNLKEEEGELTFKNNDPSSFLIHRATLFATVTQPVFGNDAGSVRYSSKG